MKQLIIFRKLYQSKSDIRVQEIKYKIDNLQSQSLLRQGALQACPRVAYRYGGGKKFRRGLKS